MPANHCKPHTAEAKARISRAKTGKPNFLKRRKSKIVDGIEYFQCGSCKSFFPKSGFHLNNRTLLGIKSQCKSCHGRCSILSRNPENTRRLRRECQARRRARAANCAGNISAGDMLILNALWGEKCLSCKATANLQWDHVMPLSKRGAHALNNLQRLCRRCNEKKQTRYIDFRSKEQKRWAVTFGGDKCQPIIAGTGIVVTL